MLHTELLTKVWGPEYRDDLQYLRVWISRVRRKLGAAPGEAGPDQDVPGHRLRARRRGQPRRLEHQPLEQLDHDDHDARPEHASRQRDAEPTPEPNEEEEPAQATA